MALRDDIKIILVERGTNLSDLVRMLNEKYGREDTIQNLTNKLTRESLKYSELIEIAELLGYEIRLVSIDKDKLDEYKKNNPLD